MLMIKNLLRYLMQFKLFWQFTAVATNFLPSFFFTRVPKSISVELTNSCNLRCPVCPTHFAMKCNRGYMAFDTFKHLIDDFSSLEKKPEIDFWFAGEPTLHPEIVKFVKYSADRGHVTVVSTNATQLTESLSKELLKSGLSTIFLCMDGFSKESHEAYRVRSDFNEVKANIENFVRLKKELGIDTLHCTLLTLLTIHSCKQVDEITAWARDLGLDDVSFKTLSTGSYTTPEMKAELEQLLPDDPRFLRNVTDTDHTICGASLNSAVLTWDGHLGLCCIDFDKKVNFPAIGDHGFMKTYTSDESIQIRRAGFQKRHGICANCNLSNAENMGFTISFKDSP
jgi:MoaA/NifB/PqqE/SkfB family radical SAM enzyme